LILMLKKDKKKYRIVVSCVFKIQASMSIGRILGVIVI